MVAGCVLVLCLVLLASPSPSSGEECLGYLRNGSNASAELGAIPWDGRHGLEVNRRVTSMYLQHARWWQQLLDPGTNASSTAAYPTWFGFAPYASREVGRGLSVLTAVRDLRLPAALWQAAGLLNKGSFVDAGCGFLHLCLGLVASLVRRAAEVVLPAPVSTVNTAINILEHGNRLIAEHIAGASEQYILWRTRQEAAVTPEFVVSAFRLRPVSSHAHPAAAGTDSVRAVELFEAAARLVNGTDGSGALRDPRPLLAPYRCEDIIVAAFATWEAAAVAFRRGGATPEHRRWLEFGNGFVAYCEQAEAVAPAFRPRGASPRARESVPDEAAVPALSGEIARDRMMSLLTSSVQLPLRSGTWTLDNYAKLVLGEPRYYETLNWGRFKDRFLPILDAFRFGNSFGPSAVWPLPSAEPLSHLDADTAECDSPRAAP